ncbi:DUF5806 family protein [Halobaculum sp. CBA1158]|uniref:DUF5806 family protein n=1 Tax=Halobaculum sp. CBA1158 TaxID=2904243 RepID=UPI001F3F8991|nr:DUF5806 family protein [Halobaculum sp. CBA1158]UIO99932.1 DUF5806 family protein [Halobaculum sp. CBA1158]
MTDDSGERQSPAAEAAGTGATDGGEVAGETDERETAAGADAREERDVDGAAGNDGGASEAADDRTGDGDDDGGDADRTGDADDADRAGEGSVPGPDVGADVPEDVAKYDRFQKMERAEYDRVNEFLRDRTYVTAREWAIARLCADFRTETGVEMTKIGENLPELVPFMTDTYTPQAVNQARASFEEKVRKAGATFLYGAMSGFFTAEDLDDVMYESTEVAKFLLEVEGADLAVEEELAAEDKISSVMRDVREASAEVRGEEVKCPECGHVHEP